MSNIFVTKDKVYGHVSDNNKVILSPHFYWLKKKTLKLFFEFQAASYSQAVFENSLPIGNFKYIVKKLGNDFLFLAYDLEDILEKLEGLGISKKSINHIFYSQFEFNNMLPLNVGETSLIEVDGLVGIVSQKIGINDIDMTLSSLKLSREKINIKATTRFSFSPFLGFLFALFVVEYITLLQDTRISKDKKDEIVKKYKLPATSYQLNAILSKYEKQDSEQKFIRSSLDRIKHKKDCSKIEVNRQKMIAKCNGETILVGNK